MKDDIKEILDDLKIKSDRYNHHLKYNLAYENKEEDYKAKILLDYITNLQERCEYLERSNNRREDEIMSLRDECVDGETYKSRNEKAVEYINSDTHLEGWINIEHYGEREQDLLNILQGSDEE